MDPLADVSIDALDHVLEKGARIWCLPIAQIIHEHMGNPLEGLVLQEIAPGLYSRIGSSCNAHDTYIFETLFPIRKEIEII